MAKWTTYLIVLLSTTGCYSAEQRTGSVREVEVCPPDIGPCGCYGGFMEDIGYYADVSCDGNDFHDGDALKTKLNQPFPNNPNLTLYLDDIQFTLPRDLLGGKRVDRLTFTCWDSINSFPSMDPLTFQGVFLNGSLTFADCVLTDTSMEFLAGFASIESLRLVSYNYLARLIDFPLVPTLTGIEVLGTQLDQWMPVGNTPALKWVSLTNVGKRSVLNILNLLSQSESLQSLDISLNELDVVPEQLTNLINLKYLNIGANPLVTLVNGSFHLSSQLEYLIIGYSEVRIIEADAFRGDFANTFLDLGYNDIVILEEAVFKPLLTSIQQQQGRGKVNLDGNLLACGGCFLKWLVSDNRPLLPYLRFAFCSNGTAVEALDPAGYNSCTEDQTSAGNGPLAVAEPEQQAQNRRFSRFSKPQDLEKQQQ